VLNNCPLPQLASGLPHASIDALSEKRLTMYRTEEVLPPGAIIVVAQIAGDVVLKYHIAAKPVIVILLVTWLYVPTDQSLLLLVPCHLHISLFLVIYVQSFSKGPKYLTFHKIADISQNSLMALTKLRLQFLFSQPAPFETGVLPG
jgi:hypothetical protein